MAAGIDRGIVIDRAAGTVCLAGEWTLMGVGRAGRGAAA